MAPSIRLDIDGPIARVTLNRPEVLNEGFRLCLDSPEHRAAMNEIGRGPTPPAG